MQSPPFPRYLVPPRSKYSPQHHVLKYSQLPFTYTNTNDCYVLYIYITFLINCIQPDDGHSSIGRNMQLIIYIHLIIELWYDCYILTELLLSVHPATVYVLHSHTATHPHIATPSLPLWKRHQFVRNVRNLHHFAMVITRQSTTNFTPRIRRFRLSLWYLTFWRRNYYFLFKHTLYIKCE